MEVELTYMRFITTTLFSHWDSEKKHDGRLLYFT
jgi:hypothetical protein